MVLRRLTKNDRAIKTIGEIYMVNKRFIKKVLSSISTIAITFVTVGRVLMPYGVQAADSRKPHK